jgi:hypothetical protein
MNARMGKGISQKKMVNAQFRGDSFQKGLQNRRFSLICQSGCVSFFEECLGMIVRDYDLG